MNKLNDYKEEDVMARTIARYLVKKTKDNEQKSETHLYQLRNIFNRTKLYVEEFAEKEKLFPVIKQPTIDTDNLTFFRYYFSGEITPQTRGRKIEEKIIRETKRIFNSDYNVHDSRIEVYKCSDKIPLADLHFGINPSNVYGMTEAARKGDEYEKSKCKPLRVEIKTSEESADNDGVIKNGGTFSWASCRPNRPIDYYLGIHSVDVLNGKFHVYLLNSKHVRVASFKFNANSQFMRKRDYGIDGIEKMIEKLCEKFCENNPKKVTKKRHKKN